MQSTDGEQFWSAGQSLWSLITEHVSESELPKIHAALGHSLVDRYTEAHSEPPIMNSIPGRATVKSNGGLSIPVLSIKVPIVYSGYITGSIRALFSSLLQDQSLPLLLKPNSTPYTPHTR